MPEKELSKGLCSLFFSHFVYQTSRMLNSRHPLPSSQPPHCTAHADLRVGTSSLWGSIVLCNRQGTVLLSCFGMQPSSKDSNSRKIGGLVTAEPLLSLHSRFLCLLFEVTRKPALAWSPCRAHSLFLQRSLWPLSWSPWDSSAPSLCRNSRLKLVGSRGPRHLKLLTTLLKAFPKATCSQLGVEHKLVLQWIPWKASQTSRGCKTLCS